MPLERELLPVRSLRSERRCNHLVTGNISPRVSHGCQARPVAGRGTRIRRHGDAPGRQRAPCSDSCRVRHGPHEIGKTVVHIQLVLAVGPGPAILIHDEPTRGVDVGAKAVIHRIMSTLAAEGRSIIMISSEMPEVLGMSDRIIVISGGRLAG